MDKSLTEMECVEEIGFDDLQQRLEKLVNLLKERETGCFTWHEMLNEQLKKLHGLLCPLFS
ncbi:MAG: hypothetical protein AAB358_02080 [Patescibacteria group bacterium]